MSNTTAAGGRHPSASAPQKRGGARASDRHQDAGSAPGTSHPGSGWSEPDGDLSAMGMSDLLALVPRIEADIEWNQRQLRACVAMLRARHASWQEIGDALRVSRQAAWQRFQSGDDG